MFDPKPYFFHYFLQRLPKLAVAAWSCLVVASKMPSDGGTKLCSLELIRLPRVTNLYDVLGYIHVDGILDFSSIVFFITQNRHGNQ